MIALWLAVGVLGASAEAPPQPVQRGDDAFRHHDARRKFWDKQAEDWLAAQLERAEAAVKMPRPFRKAVAETIADDAEFRLIEWPEFAPSMNVVQAIAAKLAAQRPHEASLARLIAEQRLALEVQRRASRRKRDIEAVLLLVA